jgi:hypothetical protein
MNNREIVTLIYIGLFVLFAVSVRGARSALLQMLKLLVTSKVGLTLAIFLTYTATVVWMMSRLGFWDASLVGSTVLWMLLVGFAWFINLSEAGKDPRFMRRYILEAVGLGAILEVYINLEVLSILLEFVMQGFLIFVAMLNVVAKQDKQYKSVARLTSGILIAAGIGVFVYATVELVRDRPHLDYPNILDQFLLPIWLTFAAVPCIYLLALYAGYESLFLHMRFWNDNRRPNWRALAGAVVGLRGSLTDIGGFRGMAAKQAAQTSSFSTARQAVQTFKRERAADQAARAAARQRLIDNAGVQGIDADGLQLDRREFAATKSALRWLATCHMGWYQRDDRPNKYRADLLNVLGNFASEGLPDPHGIVMKVRKDGQTWCAYRITPSGHVFGIGASEGPPSQWFYDGENPPSGYPSERGGWTSFMEADRPEWREEPAIK